MSLQISSLSSALEHAIPEQMFVTPENPGEAVSAVKALQKAASQGQRIYHITQANMATALPNLRLDPETLGEIRQALNSGKEVITHTDPISVPGWQGAGYVITDMETGAGAWKIGGGLNGGELPDKDYSLLSLADANALLDAFLAVSKDFLAKQAAKYKTFLESVRNIAILTEYCDTAQTIAAMVSIGLVMAGFMLLTFAAASIGGIIGFILAFAMIEIMMRTIESMMSGWINSCRKP